MKKADLLQAFSDKFYKVLTPVIDREENGLRRYRVKVFEKDGDSLKDMLKFFYVENEGEANEAAYWTPREPNPVEATPFNVELHAFIQSKIDDGTIEGGFVDNPDERKQMAFCRAYLIIDGSLVEKRIFIDRATGANLRYRVVE